MTIHVYPLFDWIDHQVDTTASECTCLCEPHIVYCDEETGELLPEPVIIHNSVSGCDD